jgi:RNA polymerase sigma factor (sigma-70 family)
MTSHMNKEYGAENFKKYDTETDLFEALMRKDELARKQLYYEKIRLLYWLAYQFIKNKEDAEYCARLGFSKTLASNEAFNDLEHVNNYMCKAVKFACLDHIKSLKAQKAIPAYNVLPLDQEEEALADERRHDNDLIRLEFLEAVYAEIERLPTLARQMLLLFLADKKTAEIAEELGCTPRQVRDKLRALPTTLYKALINNKLISILFLLLFI